MEELQEVTIQYVNCGEPIESAARLKRVLEGEEKGMMAETSAAIISARSEDQLNTESSFFRGEPSRVRDIEQHPNQNEENSLSAMDQEPVNKKRGRPPIKKTSEMPCKGNQEKVRRKKKPKITRISPLSRVVINRAFPQVLNQATRFNLAALAPRQSPAPENRQTPAPRQISTSSGLPPRSSPAPPRDSMDFRDPSVQRLRELQKKVDPDIVFLNETKNEEAFIKKKLDLTSYESLFFVPPQSPGGGGLALFWKHDLSLSVSSACNNYIDTNISHKNNTFVATFVYGEPNQANRKAMWQNLTDMAAGRDLPWFLTGDFNDILDNDEKSGGPPRAECTFGDFRAFVSQNNLYDLRHVGNYLSWRGIR
ncbi:uncharacterized protein LOC112089810 [Eutrema salsugineum]|uniref:uncharacterized protein LOC112089810 n=1 Tax=Eutrema salsugineum TaxID=72664 RepID=UPI000CED543E|nr:uncharacterized protein LOC112089810 [Eutrema salsugineum]